MRLRIFCRINCLRRNRRIFLDVFIEDNFSYSGDNSFGGYGNGSLWIIFKWLWFWGL